MPITNTDAVLHYDIERFGQLGYAVPNPSDDIGSLNSNIVDITNIVGKNLSMIMHHADADQSVPPTINTILRVHKLYVRFVAILQARAVPPNELNFETNHIKPAGDTFNVFPVPYFLVRNQFMKRWAGLILSMLAECFQHTENANSIEISTRFSGDIGQYMLRMYQSMACELFNKTRDEVRVPGFLLSPEDFANYRPGDFFTETEMMDTVPNLGDEFTEDDLKVIYAGIPVTSLPLLKPWPTNLKTYYEQNVPGVDADSHILDNSDPKATAPASAGGGAIIPGLG